jgi:exosome complex RNA-binding protein Csl4
MKVKIAVACKYFVKKEVELPDDVVGKLEERVKGTGRIDSDGELAEYLGEVVHEADADDWEFEVHNIQKEQ